MSRPKIKDEFTEMPISRQRKYQLRKARDKRCTICGAPSEHGTLCINHLVYHREHGRKKFGSKRRYNSLSYRLEKAAAEKE